MPTATIDASSTPVAPSGVRTRWCSSGGTSRNATPARTVRMPPTRQSPEATKRLRVRRPLYNSRKPVRSAKVVRIDSTAPLQQDGDETEHGRDSTLRDEKGAHSAVGEPPPRECGQKRAAHKGEDAETRQAEPR